MLSNGVNDKRVGVYTGVTKWFSYRKGFGHVTCDIRTGNVEYVKGLLQSNDHNAQLPDGVVDVFVHHKLLPGKPGTRSLYGGDIVNMNIMQHVDGPNAGDYYADEVFEVRRT